MQRMGVAAERIHVSGFPVNPAFTTAVERRPSAAGSVLYLPSTSVRHVQATLQALRPLVTAGTRLTIAPGRHAQRLYRVLQSYSDELETTGHGEVRVLGWCDRMADLLREHDVIVCKAGGAMLHEVMAGCRPAVVDWIVPGQEEGNAQMLLAVGGGVLSASPEDTAAQVQRLLADQQREARHMSTVMAAHSRPDAALRIAELVTRQIPSALTS
jgi:processive 1,2-diacylglycerol beta-glucosyltransferase